MPFLRITKSQDRIVVYPKQHSDRARAILQNFRIKLIPSSSMEVAGTGAGTEALGSKLSPKKRDTDLKAKKSMPATFLFVHLNSDHMLGGSQKLPFTTASHQGIFRQAIVGGSKRKS